MDFATTNVRATKSAGKGRGLVAAREIGAGETIVTCPVKLLGPVEFHLLRLAPLLAAHAGRDGAIRGDGFERLMASLAALVSRPQEVMAGRSTADAGDSAIMYTFTWPRPEAEGGTTAAMVFGLASLCNHADQAEVANAQPQPDPDTLTLSLVATRDIAEGDEILMTYRSTPFAG